MRKLYLSGSMEFSSDPTTWRNQFERELNGIYKIFNPCVMNPPFKKDEEIFKNWIHENYILPDINELMTSTDIFVKIDRAVFKGSGTVSELTFAKYFNKDIVYFIDEDIKETEIPGWTLGCFYCAVKVYSIDEAIGFYKRKVGV